MKHRFDANRALITAAMLAAAGLTACGGGGDSDSSATPNSPGGAKSERAGNGNGIRVEGQSQALSSDFSTVRLVVPPVTWGANGTMPPQSSFTLSSEDFPASALSAVAPGAYTAFPFSSTGKPVNLSAGLVTDIFGNGDFAVGRWTAGSDSAGNNYNVNQGQHWAVGAPVEVTLNPDQILTCKLTASTRPTASDGNTVPGELNNASATIRVRSDKDGKLQGVYDVSFQYSIGKDDNQVYADTGNDFGGVTMSRSRRSTLATELLGPDATHPYLVLSYGVQAPTVGLVNGLAVLSCS